MNFADKETSWLEARKVEIEGLIDTDGADLNALEEEARAINAELKNRKEKAQQKQEIRNMVTAGKGTVVEKEEERTMPTEKEIRNSNAYINAYANYIKTGKADECRALLSANASGYVPVPDIVDARIRTAWERSRIMDLVNKTNLKGNVKVGFELSATGAVVHTEGTDAPAEEVLTLGIVTMVPESIKKWITVSDEALDLTGEEFLNYIYDEIAYQIAKKAESELINIIKSLPAAATATSVSANAITAAPAVDTVAKAAGEAHGSNLKVAMHRSTWAAFKAAQYAANYAIDPFEGLEVIYTDALPAYAAASTGEVYMIVGDFFEGAQANFPATNGIEIKVDNLSLAEKDLVKFVGREFVGLGAVADKRFTLIKKPAAA